MVIKTKVFALIDLYNNLIIYIYIFFISFNYNFEFFLFLNLDLTFLFLSFNNNNGDFKNNNNNNKHTCTIIVKILQSKSIKTNCIIKIHCPSKYKCVCIVQLDLVLVFSMYKLISPILHLNNKKDNVTSWLISFFNYNMDNKV